MDIQEEREAFEKFCLDELLMCPASGCFKRELN